MANEDYSNFEKTMAAFTMAIYIVTFVLGVTGNGVVICFTGFKMKRTVNTVWFLGLAVADFIFSLFLPLSFTYVALGFDWPFGTLLCKTNSWVSVLNMLASVFTLAAISLDRLVAVALPVWAQNHRGPGLATLASLAVWFAAALLSSPTLVYRDTIRIANRTICYNNFLPESQHAAETGQGGEADSDETMEYLESLYSMRYQSVTLARFFCGFLLPLLVIVACYTIIGCRLKHNHLANSAKPFKVIAAIILTFLLCWAPYHILMLLEFAHPFDQPIPLALRVGIPLSSSLACVNSCLNPILYVCMGRDFRDTVRMSMRKVLERAFTEDSLQTYTSRSRTKALSLDGEASASV
ncbi:chemerin-like receptor 1 [Heptranchias perlo]|uniref:chemerin-like receptor 1 n=1 Tax=Heptranchias perlo TaxID=212740 RepID=UPI00355A4EAF